MRKEHPSTGRLQHWVRTLAAVLVQNGAPFPLFTGPQEPIKEHGLLYLLSERERNHAPAPWFENTLVARRSRLDAERVGAPPPNYRNAAVFVLVQWAYLLWQANPQSISSLFLPAHALLSMLVDVIDQFDCVLADDIRLLEARRNRCSPEFRRDNPLYAGFHTEIERERFRLHLKTLLSNHGARQAIYKTMEQSLVYALAPSERLKLIRCPGGNRHRKGQSCDACVESKWVRGQTSLLNVSRLMVFGPSPFRFIPAEPKRYGFSRDSWNNELRRIIDGLGVSDGTYMTNNNDVLVNFEVLVDTAVTAERAGPLFDLHRDNDNRIPVAAFKARELFEQKYGEDCQARRVRPMGDLVQDAGWPWNPSTLDLPYGLYSVNKLTQKLDAALMSVYHLVSQTPRAHAKKQSHVKKLRHKLITLDYTDEAGVSHLIQCAQVKLKRTASYSLEPRVHNFYLPPYAVPADFNADKYRVGHSKARGPVRLWDLHAINQHAETRNPDGTAVIPGSDHFCQWVASQDRQLTRTEFKRRVYAQKYADRIAKKARGESSNIGLFLPHEDEALLGYLTGRENKLKMLTTAQWVELEALLPGRGKRGISKRINTLGRAYCKTNGWVAYVNSGLCLKRTASRRKQWSDRRRGI